MEKTGEKQVVITNNSKKQDVLEEMLKLLTKNGLNKEERYNFIVLICKYALITYDIESISLEFVDCGINDAGTYGDGVIQLSKKLFNEEDCDKFDFIQSIMISLFHEANHIYIDEIRGGTLKGLNGETNVHVESSSAYIFLKLLKKDLSSDDYKNFKKVLYYNSQTEQYAFKSSFKLSLKLIDELLSLNKKLQTKLDFFNACFALMLIKKGVLMEEEMIAFQLKIAKIYKTLNATTIRLHKYFDSAEKLFIVKILQGNKLPDYLLEVFEMAINDGWYKKETIDRYKSKLLEAENLSNDFKFYYYTRLLNIDNYPLESEDLINVSNLYLKLGGKNAGELCLILNKIKPELVKKYYIKAKEKQNERIS